MAGQGAAQNIHATAVIIADRGLLIVGQSGSGKTTLALALVDAFALRGKFARLVGDDQLFVEAHGGRLVCRAPAAIAGLAEIPGIGPRPVLHEPGAVIDLVVRLVPAAEVPRYQEQGSQSIAGCTLPAFSLAQRNNAAALLAIAAHLKNPSFRQD
jgi:serine kinase of HPr protein (carbohydrate metabolism regulator)